MTTEWETILFIGGPADGKYLGIPRGRADYTIIKPKNIDLENRTIQAFLTGVLPPPPRDDRMLYHRIFLHGRHDPCSIMAAEGMDADGVMERLMLYYRPPEQKEEE